MPQIKLIFGKMDLEQDPTSKTEKVSAMLYNAFRNADSFHRLSGLSEFADTDTGTGSSVYVYFSTLHDVSLAVSGGNLYLVNDSVSTLITGAILTTNTPASFCEDATRIMIAANSGIHVYTVATGVLTILGGQAPLGVTHISNLRGFLLANGLSGLGDGISGDFNWSKDDYTVWNIENNAARPDRLQALFSTINDDIFMIGSETIEINYLSGDVSAPFAVNKTSSLTYGTPAPYSVAFDGQNLYALVTVGGSRHILRLVNGREPQLIGFPVSVPIDNISNVDDMVGYIQSEPGRSFYVLTSPTAQIEIENEMQTGFTLAFDIRNEEWYVWGDWDSQNTEYQFYKGRSFAYAEPWANRRLVGGNDGKIYLMDDSATFGDDPIRMVLRMGWRSYGSMKWKNCTRYSYDFKAGTGGGVFRHRWRNDGELTWSTPRTISMGAIGERMSIRYSRQCGRYRKRQDEMIFSDADEVVFNGIFEDVEVEK